MKDKNRHKKNPGDQPCQRMSKNLRSCKTSEFKVKREVKIKTSEKIIKINLIQLTSCSVLPMFKN